MNIGAVAKRSGVSAKNIRYYESVGLLAEPQRSGNGYRQYTDRDVQILGFIQRARGLGFSVNAVRDLLDLWQDRGRASADVKRLATDHIHEIDERMQQLQEIRNTLTDLVHECHGDQHPECPILDSLAGD